MARGINKVIIVGNLGQDPEVKYMPSGGAVCNITVATSESWNDKSTGEKQERTEWHRIVFYLKLAEIAGEYLRKGSQVYVEGKLQTRKWQDQGGADRYTTEIVANEMQMLGGRGSASSGASSSGSTGFDSSNNQASAAPASSNTPAPAGGGMADDFDDDIPF